MGWLEFWPWAQVWKVFIYFRLVWPEMSLIFCQKIRSKIFHFCGTLFWVMIIADYRGASTMPRLRTLEMRCYNQDKNSGCKDLYKNIKVVLKVIYLYYQLWYLTIIFIKHILCMLIYFMHVLVHLIWMYLIIKKKLW